MKDHPIFLLRDPLSPSRPFLLSFAAVLVLFILGLAVFTPFYLINDDEWLLFISKGVGISLKPDEHVFFNNILLGFLLKALYTWAPKECWYTYYLLATQWISFGAFLSACLLRSKNRAPLLLFIISFIYLGLFYLAHLNYTLIAILAFQGGIFLWSSTREKLDQGQRYKALFLGSACLLLSALTRLDAFLFSACLALPFLLKTVREGRPGPGVLKPAFITGALIILFTLFDHWHYQRDPAWNRFAASYPPTANLQVNKTLEYNDKTKPFFDDVGWTRNDFNLFTGWYYLDAEKYGHSNIQRLNPHFGYYKSDGFSRFLSLFSTFFAQNALVCFLLFLLLTSKVDFPLIGSNFCWILALLLALSCFARVPERLVYPAFFFLVFLSIYHAVPPAGKAGPWKKGKWIKTVPLERIVLAGVFVLAAPTLYTYIKNNEIRVKQFEVLKYSISQIRPTDHQLYVVWDSCFPFEMMSASSDFEFFRGFHIFALAPFQRSPIAQEMLDRFGVKNLFLDLVDNPDFFIICSPAEGDMYRKYMREKHRMEIYPEKTFAGPFFNVFRIHSKPPGGG